jgi:heptosyltransferase-3
MSESPRILVIRRDNIGDLVCTTPLLAGLRRHYPKAYVAALVNSYNREVLTGNPDVDTIYSYTKAKHRQSSETLIGVYAQRLRMFHAMRRDRFDVAILAAPRFQAHALRFARLAGARQVLGFVDGDEDRGLELPVPYGAGAELHEVEDVWRLLTVLGIEGPPPALKVRADRSALQDVSEAIQRARGHSDGPDGAGRRPPLVALHLSARRASQRWPVEHYAELAARLHASHNAAFIILWAPGAASNPLHPGDDDKARALGESITGIPAVFYPTHSLTSLIAALAASDMVVCPDGGAMHLAAATGKPVVSLFGDSPPSRWRPWAVPHVLLHASAKDVCNISAAEVASACARLLADC